MIPKILHQGWVGPLEPPEMVKSFCADMRKMNPDFEYRWIDNDTLNRYAQDTYVKHMISRGEKWAFVMDRLRILALKEHGGIWIDPDSQPLRPLNVLDVWKDDRWDFLTAHRSPYHPPVQVKRGVAVVDNTVMGSAKNGRVINELFRLNDSRQPVRKGSEYGWHLMHIGGGDIFWEGADTFYSLTRTPKAVLLHDSHNLATWCDKPSVAQR